MVLLPTYRIPLLWDGVQRVVTVMEAENDPLIGMALLEGYRLTVDTIDGGPVTIGPIARANPGAGRRVGRQEGMIFGGRALPTGRSVG